MQDEDFEIEIPFSKITVAELRYLKDPIVDGDNQVVRVVDKHGQ